jgi:hypothetical protein
MGIEGDIPSPKQVSPLCYGMTTKRVFSQKLVVAEVAFEVWGLVDGEVESYGPTSRLNLYEISISSVGY